MSRWKCDICLPHEQSSCPSLDCSKGRHLYRLVSLGPDGTDEGATYRCEDCGSTDPEGDSVLLGELREVSR